MPELYATADHATDLLKRHSALQAQSPRLRIRDAATTLGVSEMELVAADPANRALKPDWPALLPRLQALGPVMALTRNEACVHERHGRYEKIEINGGMGLVLGPDIDLRLFLRRWIAAYACTQALASGLRHSLQFFGADGQAVHKIYLTEASDRKAHAALVAEFAGAEPPPRPTRRAQTPALRDDSAIDVAALRRDWYALRDTHDFFGLLQRHHVARVQALRLVGAPLAHRVRPAAVPAVLERAAAAATPIMLFVGNPGCIQIHSGPVQRIERRGAWLNVLDPQFNLHLREDAIAECWIVRKPTDDGVVTALEVFDAAGELIVQAFGARKPGQSEAAGWRALVSQVQQGHAA